MLRANRELVLVIAGLFLFLPFLAFALQMSGTEAFDAPEGARPTPEQMNAAVATFVEANWLAMLLIGLAQMAGAIALIRILADRARPTVGSSLAAVPGLLLPMIAAQLVSTLLLQLPLALPAFLPGAVAGLFGLLGLAAAIYLSVKFSLVSPALVLGDTRNPLTAIRASWHATKGNSFRLFAFYVLLMIATLVLLLVASLFFGLIFALLGERGAQIASSVFLAFSFALIYTGAYAVVAAVYRQVSARKAVSVPRSAAD